MVLSARTKRSIEPPAPRAAQAFSSKDENVGDEIGFPLSAGLAGYR